MSKWKIVIEELANRDLQEAYQWYEKAQLTLGDEFIDEFEIAVDKIAQNPYHTSLRDNS